jgi:hypothetical protein
LYLLNFAYTEVRLNKIAIVRGIDWIEHADSIFGTDNPIVVGVHIAES